MHFDFTDDQQFLRQTALDIVVDLSSSATVRAALDDGSGKVRSEAWQAVAELGWAGVLVPEELGGSGGTLVDACILAEVLAGALAPVPFVGTAIGAASLLAAAGDAERQQRLAAGEPFCLAVDQRLQWPSAEPRLAFDWLPGATALQIGPDGSVAAADTTPPEDRQIDPLHPLGLVTGLSGELGELSEANRRVLASVRVGLAAAAVGLGAAALDEAVAYAKERVQYGRPIAEFQAIQHICADMLVEVEASRSMAYGAAWTVENEPIDEAERVVAAAAAWCGPASVRVVEMGIQVLGGIGVTWEHDAPLRLRHAQLLNRAFGGPEAATETLAAHALAAKED